MPEPIRLTINEAVHKPTALTTYDLPDFEALAVELIPTEGAKEDSDLLVPVAEWRDLHRSVANIAQMARIFVGDLDRLTEKQEEVLCQCLEGLSCIVYTTHSHRTPKKDGLACYRVIVELDEEYLPEAHEALWRAANARFSGLLDSGARTPEQGYYLPSYPVGFGHFAEVWRQEGEPWKVSDLLGEVPSQDLGPSEGGGASPPPSLFALTAQINSWVRSQTDRERKTAGKAAKALLNGKNEIPVGEGQRNSFLITLAGFLAHAWPNSEGIAQLFAGEGWDLLNSDGKYPISAFSEMISRMQEQERAKIAEIRALEAQERREAILRSTGGQRDHEITPEEVKGLTEIFGPWRQHLIGIHKRDLFFLRPDGTYDPGAVMDQRLFVAARDRLAVFGDHVEYAYEDASGVMRRKGEKAFLEEYGSIVRAVVFDMNHPRGGWDPQTETILFPAATPVVEPCYHDSVHRWLGLLDDHLLDMLATIPHFNRMLPALVLTGGASSGKTVLAKGIGQIYGSDPLDAEAAFSNFNASTMTKQPIIFMDEKVAEAYRREGTTLVRRFLTQGSRMLDEKYQARVELRGYPRLVIAANNLDVLNTREEMTAEDRFAFSERLIHIDMDPGKEFLNRQEIQRDWIDGKYLAQHIRWLSFNHQIVHSGRRFAVASNQTRLHDGLASRSGFAGDVAYWLLSFVADPERATAAHLPIELSEGKLRVNTAAMVQGWGHYLRDHRPPTPSQVSRALRSLSTGSRQKITIITEGGTKRVDAHEIDPRLLRSANESHRLVENFDRVFNLTENDK